MAKKKVDRVVQTGKKSQIQIKATEFKGKEFIDIRNFYLNDEDEYVPSGKGISIPRDNAKAVYKYLKELLQEEEILPMPREK